MLLDSVFTWRTSAFQTSQNGLVDSLVPRLGGAFFLQVVKRIEKKVISGNCRDACGGWNRAERCMDTASIADRRCSAGIKLSHRAEQAARDVAPAHKVWTCKVFPSKLLLYNPAFAPPTGFLRLGYPLTFGAVHTTSQCPGQGLAGACRQ